MGCDMNGMRYEGMRYDVSSKRPAARAAGSQGPGQEGRRARNGLGCVDVEKTTMAVGSLRGGMKI